MRKLTAITTISIISLALAACSPSGEAGPTQENVPTNVSTELTTEPITLTVAYCDAHPVEDLLDGFTALHANVTFEKQYEDCGNFSTDVVNKLTSDSAPDIVQYVDAAIQTTAPAGQVLDLGPYAEAYGWAEKFPASQLAQLQLSADGKVHGEGAQYGIPGGASFTGLYYNKALLAQAGIAAAPVSLAEFEAALAALKEAGITPIALGSLDDGGIHLWGGLLINALGAPAAQDWVNGKAGATIDLGGATETAAKLADWAAKGYFPDSANGTKEDDARAEFAQGKAAFTADGSWAVGTVAEGLGDDAGFVAFPAPDGVADGPATGQSFTAGFAISAKTQKADAAAAFLNYLASAEAAEISVGLGMLPVNLETAPAPAAGVATDLRNAYAQAAQSDGLVTFLDHATPTMHTALTQGLQGVIAGQTTPSEFISSLQADWDSDKG
ncbi:MAG: extracellular solute-binding protein [Propionibacteriaceae bacterium]|jgi:ABC-type glycerol-3-phosphate transport system substrate-binding protein|nr:extracellular solute-binding protein [Propionibacteriaceae bacterium]